MAPAGVDKEVFNRRLLRLYNAWKVIILNN
jgi:hypothetical protein